MSPNPPPVTRRIPRAGIVVCCISALALVTGSLLDHSLARPKRKKARRVPGRSAFVIRAVDGDTLEVKIGRKTETVRLIGVDTPETSHPKWPTEFFGKQAKAFTMDLAEGKKVGLVSDPRTGNRGRHGRLVRFVYLPDGRMLNELIISHGYGFAFLQYAHRYRRKFVQMEKRARKKGVGLWARKGLAEIDWNLAHGFEPFRIHEMTNRALAVEYAGHIKTHVEPKEIRGLLEQVRKWAHETDRKGLGKRLRAKGWVRYKPRKSD